MVKRGKSETKKKSKGHNGNNHPRLKEKLSLGQRAADNIAGIGGSWVFILGFLAFLVVWMALNVYLFKTYGKTWDHYPFILLNLVLSCLAAIQAPIILMAQNRQAQRDRIDAAYDHGVNRKAEREIQAIQRDLKSVRRMIRRLGKK